MKMNQIQQQAVVHKDGPMLVLAGPGSGKTLVITERTKYLLEKYKIPEGNILVITFTKAAAEEMKQRFLAGTGSGHTNVTFGTFHAVFFMILKHAYHLTADNIIRDDDKVRFLKEVIHDARLDYADEKGFVADLLAEISLVKGNQIQLENYYSTSSGDELFRKIYTEYNRKLSRAHLIDFDDMLLFCHRLLSERKDILKLWQNKFQYILIDEFQDINKVQYDIIRELSLPRNNIFVVGDDDQSIYRFRGAKPEIMLNFPSDYPKCSMLYLDKNYRSTEDILSAGGRLIGHNQKRFEKEADAVRGIGKGVKVIEFTTMSEQNRMIAGEILKLNKEGMSFSDIAVLVRTNMGSGPLIHILMEYNIPFYMKDNLPNLFDHWVATDLISYMKIAMGSRDRSLYLQITNRPKRYISRECFEYPEVDFEDLMEYYEDRSWMLERVGQFRYDLSVLAKMGPYAAINYIRKGIGYEDYLKEYADLRKMNVEELNDILDELQENAREYKTYRDWFRHIQEYKEELGRQAAGQRRDHMDRVTVATMHGSKGLEFKTVFIADANEGITPHKKAVLASDIEEERRLFYVAMTRAKDNLYILSAKERYNKVMQRSRFIDELEL